MAKGVPSTETGRSLGLATLRRLADYRLSLESQAGGTSQMVSTKAVATWNLTQGSLWITVFFPGQPSAVFKLEFPNLRGPEIEPKY